jgi:anti-sigma factor RsiW
MTSEHEVSDRDESLLLVHALLDGELDPANAAAVERRIAADPALIAERERIEMLRRALAERLPREPLPPHLRMRVERTVGLARERPSWRALAASVALAAVLASGSTWYVARTGDDTVVADEVVSSHLRALLAPQPFDVASSDRHTVKPWFNGRTQQAPRVVDLAGEGFPLAGGRVDVIAGSPVPTLVYRARQHVISVSAIPAARASAPRAIKGYNLVEWTDNGLAYWAVSDLGASDLEAFARAFRNATPD